MNESLKLNKTNFVLQTCNIIALKLFLSHFFSSKELFKIPKKQQVEERKRIEKELGKNMYYTSTCSLICPTAFSLLNLTVCLMESDSFLFYLTGMPKDKDLEILEMIQDKSKQRGKNLPIIIMIGV